MLKIAVAVALLALTGCVAPMPPNDENNRILNQYHAPDQWTPRMLFE